MSPSPPPTRLVQWQRLGSALPLADPWPGSLLPGSGTGIVFLRSKQLLVDSFQQGSVSVAVHELTAIICHSSQVYSINYGQSQSCA